VRLFKLLGVETEARGTRSIEAHTDQAAARREELRKTLMMVLEAGGVYRGVNERKAGGYRRRKQFVERRLDGLSAGVRRRGARVSRPVRPRTVSTTAECRPRGMWSNTSTYVGGGVTFLRRLPDGGLHIIHIATWTDSWGIGGPPSSSWAAGG
jgi:hypothetical protein